LSPEVLETVRLLSNFETPSAKLIQIVLSGQPQLAEKLSRPELLQLRQRICVWRKLESLNPDEVAAYIEHRLEVAGYSGGTIFDQGALDLIAKQSKGIPRNINSLCFGALSVGFALRQKTIGTSVMNEVIADLSLDRLLYREPFAKGAQKESEKVADISSVRWP
jgi:general secretion pathway protein A